MKNPYIGQRVQFKPAGKCARLEGMAGKLVTATITALHPEENAVSLMADYRTLPGATFKDMGSFVETKKLKAI
jgi:hypothetical protein